MKVNNPPKPKYIEDWDTFWKNICEDNDGNIKLDQIKKELSDYNFLLEQIPKIYCHITGNTLSKTTYHSATVINCSDNYRDKWMKEVFNDFIDDNIDDEEIDDVTGIKLKKLFNEYI